MVVPGRIDTLEQLEALYRQPSERAVDKQFSAIDAGLAALYASTWNIDEQEMRSVLNTSYEGDLSRD
jgi:hypothetical protein